MLKLPDLGIFSSTAKVTGVQEYQLPDKRDSTVLIRTVTLYIYIYVCMYVMAAYTNQLKTSRVFTDILC
jgi:hypothetical protein